MPPKKDAAPSGGKGEGRGQNGNRSGFRTDTAISNRGAAGERVLQPWVPDSTDGLDASLEGSTGSGAWDQFAANERLFGLKTDYDENIYTTAINKSHPQYRERIAAADRKAREIERSAPTTAHVAEERVMDFNGTSGGDDNEEEKYSGVRRQDFPPLGSGRENRYTPPAKRAPAAQSNVKGAPVDPAIISSQIKAPPKKQTPAPSDQSRGQPSIPAKNETASQQHIPKAANSQTIQENPANSGIPQPKETKASEAKVTVSPSAATYSAATAPKIATGATEKTAQPSATSTVERDVLNSFKTFATQQRINAEKVRNSKAKADKEVKLTELRKFATNFKLSTPVPNDLVSIIAKDPAKQKEIQARAIRNAEDVARAKADASSRSSPASGKDTPPKSSEQGTTMPPVTDPRHSRTPAGPHTASPAGAPNRHAGPRQPYPQQYHSQGYRNNRGGPHNMPTQQTGSLAQRLRNVEQQKFSQPPAVQQPPAGQDARAPPTGPAGTNDANFNRRHSALPGHVGVKLNPNSHEFRPSPFAAAFNPINQASASSSPRAAANTVTVATAAAAVNGKLIRRKTKAVDATKCCILSHIKKIAPPQGRNWDDNGGLRPSYDTLPTWRQLRDDEKADSTMHLTYKQYFERNPFSETAMATPNPSPAMPHLHQLPFHLQHGSHNMGQRQSPAMPPMQMHTPHHGPGPHGQYGTDDHRMMHSNSQQSFASPRMAQMTMAYNTPGQVVYNPPVYMGGGTPQMGQYRSFSNNHPQYAPPQGPMMMQPHFMHAHAHAPQGMVGGPQLMYPGVHGQFMPPTGPPQQGPVANGYPSPGRPSAPAMAHQGSQQGQPMYGMSPSVQYNQPVYGQGQGGGQ